MRHAQFVNHQMTARRCHTLMGNHPQLPASCPLILRVYATDATFYRCASSFTQWQAFSPQARWVLMVCTLRWRPRGIYTSSIGRYHRHGRDLAAVSRPNAWDGTLPAKAPPRLALALCGSRDVFDHDRLVRLISLRVKGVREHEYRISIWILSVSSLLHSILSLPHNRCLTAL